MPKQTFLNLDPSKRARIVGLAIEEFGRHPYHQASLSRIVAAAGIAKGSIYQYFENKLDLYRWLLTDELPRRKLAYLQRAGLLDLADRPALPALLKQLVMAGIGFMLAEPELSHMALAIGKPTDDPQLRTLYGEAKRQGHDGFVALLGQALAHGELRSDVDLDLIARVLGAVLGHGVPSLLEGALGIDLHALLANPAQLGEADRERLRLYVRDVVTILIEGVRGPVGR